MCTPFLSPEGDGPNGPDPFQYTIFIGFRYSPAPIFFGSNLSPFLILISVLLLGRFVVIVFPIFEVVIYPDFFGYNIPDNYLYWF